MCVYVHICIHICVGYMCVGMCSHVYSFTYGCSWVSSMLALHFPEAGSHVETETPKFG